MLIIESERISKHLNEVVGPVNELRSIAKESSHDIKELCSKCILSVSGIDSVVVRIKSIGQIRKYHSI